MFSDLLNTMTAEARAELAARGITRQLLSDWRTERRLPTEVQVADLADVTGAEWVELQKEVTVLRAPKERREQIANAIKWRRR